MSFPTFLAIRTSKQITKWIGVHWGERFPMYFVSEHPKSGGTWVSRMVADYLQAPFPQMSIFPIGCRAVIQNMWTYDPRLRNVFYVYRDGRDVMTSFFFDRLRIARHSNAPARKRIDRTYRKLLGENYDAADSVRLLPRFMEYEFQNPGRGAPVNWPDHVTSWYDPDNRPHLAYLSYEGLLEDCAGTLGRAIERITGEPIDDWRLSTTVEKFSMRRLAGRKRGEEDPSQHIRKGVAGDWKNHFSREAAEVFNDYAGDALVMLGYEQDRGWIDRYDYVEDGESRDAETSKGQPASRS